MLLLLSSSGVLAALCSFWFKKNISMSLCLKIPSYQILCVYMPGPIRPNGKMPMFCNHYGEQLKKQTEIERSSCKCESHKKKTERTCLATEAILSPLSMTYLPKKGLGNNKILTFFAILSTWVTHNRKLLVVMKF